MPAVSEQPIKSDAASADPVKIEIGQVIIRLDAATGAARIADIVRAIGSSVLRKDPFTGTVFVLVSKYADHLPYLSSEPDLGAGGS